ncbi:hypothetical protein MUP77_19265 [Candidatus Bathyarchaeota archaeon]|nr:hypothetical protein [Candidatus Bathyarchaeota archaeon]
MPQQSRRKFLYAGAGIAAVVGIGYLTKDYWHPIIQEEYKEVYRRLFPEASPTITPTTTAVTETPTPVPTQSPTSTVTPTETSTGQMSEDEVMIRELFHVWQEALNSGNENNLGNLYTDKATVDFGCSSTRAVVVRGLGEIIINYHHLAAEHHLRVDRFVISELKIQGNKARVLGNYDLTINGGTFVKQITRHSLLKATEIKRGSSTLKLPKPLWWKISEEYNHCIMDG